MPDRSDDELVRAILYGEAISGEILFDRYYQYVYKIMYRRTFGHPQSTEDLTHNVWIKMLDSLRAYKPQGKFKQWLNTVIQSVHIDWLRREGRFQLLDDGNHEVTLEHLHDASPLPEIELEKTELQGLIHKSLEAMPHDAERTAFMLRDLEEYSLAEIAQALGVSENGAKMKAFRGRQKFREIFQRLAGDYL